MIYDITMRTLIDIPNDFVDQLAILGKQLKTSRSHLIRMAIALFLKEHRPLQDQKSFGAWKRSRRQTDRHLKKIKSEWK